MINESRIIKVSGDNKFFSTGPCTYNEKITLVESNLAVNLDLLLYKLHKCIIRNAIKKRDFIKYFLEYDSDFGFSYKEYIYLLTIHRRNIKILVKFPKDLSKLEIVLRTLTKSNSVESVRGLSLNIEDPIAKWVAVEPATYDNYKCIIYSPKQVYQVSNRTKYISLLRHISFGNSIIEPYKKALIEGHIE